MLLSKIWRGLFPEKTYRVYVKGLNVYRGTDYRKAVSVFNDYTARVLSWRDGGSVVLILRERRSKVKAEVLRKIVVKTGRENDTINRDLPFTSGD